MRRMMQAQIREEYSLRWPEGWEMVCRQCDARARYGLLYVDAWGRLVFQGYCAEHREGEEEKYQGEMIEVVDGLQLNLP